MAFTKALYYPWIDIKNDTWLKNAMLYWDSIQTIVPQSVSNPYKNDTSKEFYENGYLIPLRVNSRMDEIETLQNEVLKYLNSKEAAAILLSKENSNSYRLYKDKLPHNIQMIGMYPEKLPQSIRYTFENFPLRDNDSFLVNKQFASFYMTLLSAKLADVHGISLLTESSPHNILANSSRFEGGAHLVNHNNRYPRFREKLEEVYLKKALLSEILLEKINLSADTTVKKIIKFKEKHKDELGRFRTKIDELGNTLKKTKGGKAIKQQIEDLISNEINPAISDLKSALKSNRIRFVDNGLLKISLFSAPPTSLTIYLAGVEYTPHAIFAGAAISITTQAILYNKEKRNILNSNPYSYLLSLEKKFSNR